MRYTTLKMKVKKEATVAVVIGLILALIVTGGVIRARHAFDSIRSTTKDLVRGKDVGKPDTKSVGLFLDLSTPDNSVTTEPKLTLAGKTLPGSYIAILGEKGEYLIVPSDVGNFSQEIGLVKGANTIKISVYQTDGTKIEKTLNAVYTTAEI